jgi:hypothetical protein
MLHCKFFIVFPVPSRDVTNQTLPGWELLNYFRLERVWLVTSRLGTGKTITFFYSVPPSRKVENQAKDSRPKNPIKFTF